MGPEALGRLIDQHAAALVLYARQWCASPEDVVQEAFVKLSQSRETPRNVVNWLFRVVRNGALTAARAERRRQQHELIAGAKQPVWFVADESSRLDATQTAAALSLLQADQREAIVAHLWGQLTFGEIGELMGTSSSSAHRHYLAGLAALRERLHVPCPNRSRTEK
jgi:RNA polymerase sigma factor (sigma-70 family)